MKENKTTETEATAATPPAEPPAPSKAVRTERRSVRYTFNEEELTQIRAENLDAFDEFRNAEAEAKETAASFKAKLERAKSRMIATHASLRSGFEMRTLEVTVHLRPKDRKKDFRRKDTGELVGTEPMEQEDYQLDLIQAEAEFERREEIQLFPPVGKDFGTLVVGRLMGRWFAALRVSVGPHSLAERLDKEQKAVKHRADAVRQAAKRALEWLTSSLGPDAAKGFELPINNAIAAHKEREE